MLLVSIISLILAAVSVLLSITTQDEICKVSMLFISGFLILLALIFAPVVIKLVIVIIPFILDKFNYWSINKSSGEID